MFAHLVTYFDGVGLVFVFLGCIFVFRTSFFSYVYETLLI